MNVPEEIYAGVPTAKQVNEEEERAVKVLESLKGAEGTLIKADKD